MIMAEMAAFDNLDDLVAMGADLAGFVREAAADGMPAHEVERGIWERVLAIGRQATGHFFQLQGDGNVAATLHEPAKRRQRVARRRATMPAQRIGAPTEWSLRAKGKATAGRPEGRPARRL